MNRLLDGLCKILCALMALMLAAMVVLVFGNVVLRYGFNSGITVSEEVSRWLFVWLTFIGATVAVRERGHLGTDMVVARLPVVGKKACLEIGQALMLYVSWLLFSGSLTQARLNFDVEAPVTGFSMAMVYAAGVVFSILTGALLLIELLRTLSGRVHESELVMVQESEDLAQIQDLHLDQSNTFKR